jgi:hypothetical protein
MVRSAAGAASAPIVRGLNVGESSRCAPARLRGMSQKYKSAYRSNRLAADLQKSLTVLFDGIDKHISGLIADLVETANETFWSASAVNA